MIFTPAGIDGAWVLRPEPHHDGRGFFARLWCAAELAERSLAHTIDQCSLSYTRTTGTIRGLHYQAAPREEVKIVRCLKGAVYDVLADLRPGSPTFRRWIAQELTPENRVAMYVPEGVAHGLQTLADDSEVLYMISQPYDAALARGVRWNDPAFGIDWPLPPAVMSERDRTYPDFPG
jgi:dTDP-4-dehydrorhamnose 3,5-epimerase